MLRKIYFLSLFLGINMLILFACNKFAIRPLPPNDSSQPNWPLYRGNLARTGFPEQKIRLPLDLVWTFKPNTAIERSLILVDSVIYFGTLDGYIYAVHMRTAKKLAKRKIRIPGTCVYHDHHLIIARRYGDHTLYNLDLKTGKYLWEIDAGDIESEPLVSDNWIYVAALYQHVDRYDVETGNRSWTFKTKSQLRGSPAISKGILIVGSDDGTIYAIDCETGEERWNFRAQAAISATPVIINSTVYIGSFDHYLYALDLLSGHLQWKFATSAKIYYACAVTETKVVTGSNDHFVYCLNSKTGEQEWKFKAKSIISTAPTIANNLVFFGSMDKNLYALELSNGASKWQFKAKGRVRTGPIVYGDYLIGASENNYLYAFRTKN